MAVFVFGEFPMNSQIIEIGDMVRITFERGGGPIKGTVSYVPESAGDNWIILDQVHNLPIHVQNFSTIQLIEKAPAIPQGD